MKVILNSVYLGNLAYFSALKNADEVIIEQMIKGRKALAKQSWDDAASVVGGNDNLKRMFKWAQDNLTAEEVAATLEYIKGDGEYTVMFWLGQWMTYILPMLFIVLSRVSKSDSILKLAAILSLVGLYLVKHVWLMIPQLLPMS